MKTFSHSKNFKGVLLGKNRYFYLSPQSAHQLVVNLSLEIYQGIKAGKIEKPDVVVAIAKGALGWARSLADWLNIPELSSLQIIHYKGVGEKYRQPVILQSLPIRVQGETLLLFDDIADTGKTLKLAKNNLLSMGAEKVITAAIFYKKGSCFMPDFFASQTAAWIIFHTEVLESVKDLGARWLNEGLNLSRIKERFLKLGIKENEINNAMQIVFNYPSPL